MSMASSGWAAERSTRTLDWLYSRPISAAAIFWIRALALSSCLALWLLVALLFNFAPLDGYGFALAAMPFVFAEQGIPAIAAILGLAIGAGLLSSALCRSARSSFRVSVLLLGATLACAVLALRAVPHRDIFRVEPGGHLAALSGLVLVTGMALAFLLGAWRAMRESPDDGLRWRRALQVTIPLGALIVATQLGLLYAPLLSDSGVVRGQYWMGDDSHLELRQALGTRFHHPVILDGKRQQTLRSIFSWGIAFTSPQNGLAILDAFPDRWLLIDRQGSVRDLGVQRYGAVTAYGWSPLGHHFLWKPYIPANIGAFKAGWDNSRFLILNGTLEIETLDAPTEAARRPWSATWIDDERLLLTTVGSHVDDSEPAVWVVMNVHGAVEEGPVELPPGAYLDIPLAGAFRHGGYRLATLHGEQVVPLAWLDREARSLVTLAGLKEDSEAAIYESPALLPSSLGSLEDGSLVWIELDEVVNEGILLGRGELLVKRLASADTEAQITCRFAARTIRGFRGRHGPWAVWDGISRKKIFACNAFSGEVREIDDVSPGWWHDTWVGDRGIWTGFGWVTLPASAESPES